MPGGTEASTALKVGIFIPKEREYDREAMRRRESLSGEEDTISCYLASPEGIILFGPVKTLGPREFPKTRQY
jgi:hypothetical protein